MNLKNAVASTVAKKTVHYLQHDPIENFPKIIRLGNKLTAGRQAFYGGVLNNFQAMWDDEKSPWRDYFIKYLTWLDPNERDKFVTNFLIKDSVVGFGEQEKLSEKYGCNIPWAILIDPTSACNLKCTGCWAAEYSKQSNLSYDELDGVVKQGCDLSCYFYIFSGGEPLIRKDDIIKLCAAHQDCIFAAFTNGTLIDGQFCEEIKRVGNFFPILSIEGFEEATDMRRGEGTFKKVVAAMDLLKQNHLAFGFSCCYHSQNVDDVASDEFIDFMIEKGAWFGWYFTFMPVGTGSPVELMVNPDQRAYMYKRVREIRERKPIFVLDFWNDGEFVEGCIAGGRRYFHINSNGDAEPCAFIHYATENIRQTSLLNILRSPLFMQYHDGQPFNGNHLRPCPLLDNPNRLSEMVKVSGAHSTQPVDSEDVDELTAKCAEPSKKWAETADALWEEHCKDCLNHAHCKTCTFDANEIAKENEKRIEKEKVGV
jgi:MoaA/NifB/PqqE/SkfB family radical SAM enzyme